MLSSTIKSVRVNISVRTTGVEYCLPKQSFHLCFANRMVSTTESTPTKNIVLFDSLSQSYLEAGASCINFPKEASTGSLIKSDRSKGMAWYTCGPTVYDSAHMGHARTYVGIDILQRLIVHFHDDTCELRPIFIMNVTDVDDKIINRSKELKQDPVALARKYEKEFFDDMDALNVMRPTLVTRVTDHVETSIIPYIEQIKKNGIAYVSSDGSQNSFEGNGSVYFDVRAFESLASNPFGRRRQYGKLAPPSASTCNSDIFQWSEPHQSKTNAQSQLKRDPRDFVLWKQKKPSDTLYWDSPWGPGRPGWHIECSAMIEATMKMFPSHKIKVHAGGIDLKFPHHTNEIAQAEAYHNMYPSSKEWIQHWFHTGHLYINGLKMSKSLKNFVTIKDFLSDSECNDSRADEFRLWVFGLSGSLSGPATFSKTRMNESKIIRKKIIVFLTNGSKWLNYHSNSDYPKQNWDKDDRDLYHASLKCSSECMVLLKGSLPDKGSECNGPKCLKMIMKLIEHGNEYMELRPSTQSYPLVPMAEATQRIREILRLVGFSRATYNAGLDMVNTKDIGSRITKLSDLFSQFRSRIRHNCLQTLRSRDSDKASKDIACEILQECDSVRQESTKIGLELLDGNSLSSNKSNWRWVESKP